MEFELERRKKETKEHDASIFYGTAVEGMKKGDAQAQNYWGLIRTNQRFRLYLLSYVTSHIGEWLTYIASLSTIEAIQAAKGMETTSGRVVSRLIIIRLVPNILFSPFGGILADGLDRRKVMICLDLVGAATVFLFVAAVQVRSIGLIYAATFIQECVSGLYEPSRSAILPMLVSGEEDMKRATTISGLAWSSVAAFGAALSGLVVGLFGVKTCFAIDCVTYVISAWLMWMVDGNWGTVTTEEDAHESLLDYIRGMLTEGTHYIWTSHFGGLVLIKATASLVYGGFDVLNVAFAERGSVKGRPFRLGILFACSGIGCLLGPMLVDPYTDVARPKTLQFTCVASFIFLTIGSIVLGFSTSFWIACTFTLIRAAGSSVLWINSSILIQKFCIPSLLGRVSSIEFALALLSESFSAYLTGRLLDESNLSAEDVSLLLGSLSAILSVGWFIYHVQGRGAVWSPEEDSSGSHSLNTYKNSLAETTALVELIS
jgi:MFS family permease